LWLKKISSSIGLAKNQLLLGKGGIPNRLDLINFTKGSITRYKGKHLIFSFWNFDGKFIRFDESIIKDQLHGPSSFF